MKDKYKKNLRKIKSLFGVYTNASFIYSKKYYSQEGEDIIINKLVKPSEGFYVDVGAHHPFRYSNTQLLYEKGWRGLNIEPDGNAIKLFKKSRKKDINVKAAVSNSSNQKLYYIFEDGAFNTISDNNAKRVITTRQSKIVKKSKIKTYTLRFILEKYIKDKKIDYMNIDVEGSELDVLKSNDWNKYKPDVISVERGNETKRIIMKYLSDNGYKLEAKTTLTDIYILGLSEN